MVVTLRTERIRTLDHVRAFLEGSEAADFQPAHERHCVRPCAPDSGPLRVLRPPQARQGPGEAVPREGDRPLLGPGHRPHPAAPPNRGGSATTAGSPWPTPSLAATTTWTPLCSPRSTETRGSHASPHISNGHIYNLRKSRIYRTGRLSVRQTRPTLVPIGIRRKPRPPAASPASSAPTPSTSAPREEGRTSTSSTSSTKSRSSNTLAPCTASPSTSSSPCWRTSSPPSPSRPRPSTPTVNRRHYIRNIGKRL